MKFRSVVLCILSLLVLGSAQSAGAFTLEQLLPDLLADHERLQAARDRREAAYFRIREARAEYYPSVDLQGEATFEQVSRRGRAATGFGRNTQSITARQLLHDFGGTLSLIDRNKAAFELAQNDEEFIRQGLMREGITAYLDLIRTSKVLKFTIQSEESIKRQTGIEESLVRRGAGISSDVLQAKSQLAEAAARRIAAQGDLVNAQNRFLAVFGQGVDQQDIVGFREPKPDYARIPVSLDDAVLVAFEDNPQMDIARQNVNVAQEEVDIARSRFFPELSLIGEQERKENDAGINEVRHESRFGLEVLYNIYNGGGDTASWRAAKLTRTEADNLVQDLARTVEEQVRVFWRDLITARERSEFLRNQANIEGEFLDLARKERKLGNRSLLDVLTAEVNYVLALSGATSSEIEQKIAFYDLLFAMGRLKLDIFVR